MRLLTRKQALADGYNIDDCAAHGPIGYKGPRFAPTAELVNVLSEREEVLVGALLALQPYLDAHSQPGERWAALCVRETLAKLNIEGEV